MEEARRVLERLDRIEALEREQALPEVLLAELRELLVEAEAWVRAEGTGADLAREALERCREALDEPRPVARGTSRTLLA